MNDEENKLSYQKYCAGCGVVLEKKENQTLDSYLVRQFCTGECSKKYRKKNGQKTKYRTVKERGVK
jgi:hypothetical protein